MAYLVLARKWRPSVFDDVVGQQHITQTLGNAVEQDRVPHALMFSGSRGIGKTSCARILAKALNCESGPTATPCGVCNPCSEIANGRSIDVFEIDGASNNSVEQIREIRESVKFVPTTGRRKIYIIDEVHMLSMSAFNALLKTLEEPPEHVLFIFATTEPHKIPDTILSRCQRFDFRRIPEGKIVQALKLIALKEGIVVPESVLVDVAREARGGMRDSLSLLDQVISFCGEEIVPEKARQVLGIAGRAQLSDMFRALISRRGEAVLSLLAEQHERGTDLEKYAHRFVDFVRDLLVVRICPQPSRILDQEEEEIQRMRSLVSELQPADLHRILGAILRHVDELGQSSFPKLRLEMAFLEVCEQGPTLPISDIIDALGNLTGNLSVSSSPLREQPVFEQEQVSRSSTEDMSFTSTSLESAKTASESFAPSSSTMKRAVEPTVKDSLESTKADEQLPWADEIKDETVDSVANSSEGQESDLATQDSVVDGSTANVSSTEKKLDQSINVNEQTESTKSYKKRPSKRANGYDDFSAPPPKPWNEQDCPKLKVKSRRNGVVEVGIPAPEADEEQSDDLSPDHLLSLQNICQAYAAPIDRYREFLAGLRPVDTFLTSDLEQNSHIITFENDGIHIAVHATDSALVDRANIALGKVFGSETGRDRFVNWHYCETGDHRLEPESIFQIRQRQAAEALHQRKQLAQGHPAIGLVEDILAGQVLDILPR